jgi:7,8-dihydro-6-hydroxymethylpterin dimethyltransferase
MPIRLPIAEPKFVLNSKAKAKGAEIFHSYTRGLCPTCKGLVDGARLLRGGKVYMRKQCPEHGESEALISGDAEWWLRSLTFLKPGSIPLEHST